jgi:hypothetical protein
MHACMYRQVHMYVPATIIRSDTNSGFVYICMYVFMYLYMYVCLYVPATIIRSDANREL